MTTEDLQRKIDTYKHNARVALKALDGPEYVETDDPVFSLCMMVVAYGRAWRHPEVMTKVQEIMYCEPSSQETTDAQASGNEAEPRDRQEGQDDSGRGESDSGLGVL